MIKYVTDLAADYPSPISNNITNTASDTFTSTNFPGNASDSGPSVSYDANGRPRRKRSKLETTEPNPAPATTDDTSNNNAIADTAKAQETAQQPQWRRRRAGSNSGSIASSRRSQRMSQLQNHQQHTQAISTEMSDRNTQSPSTRNGAAAAAAGSPSSSPATGTMSKEQSKKKNSAVSRFLTFLKCCSCSSSHEPQAKAEVGDQSEKVEPVKVAVKPQPTRETQSVPNNNSAIANTNLNNKQSAIAVESGAANSNERPDEKRGEHSQLLAPGGIGATSQDQRSHDAMGDGPASSASGGASKLVLSQEQQPPADNSTMSSKLAGQNYAFGSSYAAAVNTVGQQWKSSDDTLISGPQLLQRQQQQQLQQEQHPSQSQNQFSQAPVQGSDRESIINDQTESQKRTDTDIEMTDAGPNVPLSSRDEIYAGAMPVVPTPNSGGAAYLNDNNDNNKNNTTKATNESQSQNQLYQEYDSIVPQTGPGAGTGAGGLKLAVPPEQQTQPQAQADRTATSHNGATMGVDQNNNNNLDTSSSTAIAVGATGVAVAGAAPPSPGTSVAITPIEAQKYLLPPMRPEFRGKKCLVLDLDETLVHSSFKVGVKHYIDMFDIVRSLLILFILFNRSYTKRISLFLLR